MVKSKKSTKSLHPNGGRRVFLFRAGRAGNSLTCFLSESLIFCPKMSELAFAQKNKRLAHLLIFGERPERFTLGRSFLVSNLSESLTSLFFWWATWAICSHCSPKKREWANCSFFKLKKPWAIWEYHSQSLIWFERNEQMSDEQMSDERMSEFQALRAGGRWLEVDNFYSSF